MLRQIIQCDSQEHLFDAAAQFVVQSLIVSDRSPQLRSFALAGGSTPRGLFRRLTAEPYRSRVDWPSIQIFWGDERTVPLDHPDSNFRMAKETLLDHVPIAADHIFRMEGERAPDEAAMRYEYVLRSAFPSSNTGFPRFDLILLGMGADGHTASLFPETAVLEEDKRWVAAPWVEKFQTHRITLTPPTLNAARRVLFVVGGSDKAEAAKAVLEGPYQTHLYPAQLIQPVEGDVVWLMDRAAASELRDVEMTDWNQANGFVQ